MILNAAEDYLRRGFSVIPVAGKLGSDADWAKRPPINPHTRKMFEWEKYQTERANSVDIQRWFTDLFPNGDIGVVTGSISGVFGLDIDGVIPPGYEIPRTWTVRTKRGWHFYFKWVAALTAKVSSQRALLQLNADGTPWVRVKGEKPPCQMDTRGEGGYLVAPPSQGFNGVPYRWATPIAFTPLAEPPQWLIDLLPNRDKKAAPALVVPTLKPQDWVATELAGIQPGDGRNGRTPTFVRIIGRLKAKGLAQGEVTAMLLPHAEKHGYAGKLPGLVADQFKRYPPEAKPTNTEDDIVSFADFIKDVPTVEWLCEGMLAKKGVHFFAGLNGAMKTWTLMDLAIKVAAGGGNWLGRFPVPGGIVMFLDQERPKEETARRLLALSAAIDVSPGDLPLFARSKVKMKLDDHQALEVFKRRLDEIQPTLLIIDSFATLHNRNENHRSDIQPVLETLTQLRDDYKLCICVLHHENGFAYPRHDGKPSPPPTTGEMSGSEAIPAAADIVYQVRKHGHGSMIYNTKNNPGELLAPVLVNVVIVTADKKKIKVEAV